MFTFYGSSLNINIQNSQHNIFNICGSYLLVRLVILYCKYAIFYPVEVQQKREIGRQIMSNIGVIFWVIKQPSNIWKYNTCVLSKYIFKYYSWVH